MITAREKSITCVNAKPWLVNVVAHASAASVWILASAAVVFRCTEIRMRKQRREPASDVRVTLGVNYVVPSVKARLHVVRGDVT
jgi:hypothetical protein